MLKIKICGLRDPRNIGEIAGTSPDFMGFVFYPKSPRYAGHTDPVALRRKIPGDIIKTGVFVDEDPVKLSDICREFEISAVQLHGSETPDYCRKVRSAGFITIKAFGVSSYTASGLTEKYSDCCDYFLFDTLTKSHGGSGRRFNWDTLHGIRPSRPYFLSGGIGIDSIDYLKNFDEENLFGIDINSRFELSPGVKDVKLITKFINEIRKMSYEIQCG